MLRDLRLAVRVLLQAKAWTAVVLVSLALGIGANTALFSAINGLLLQTIAVTDPDALVRLSWTGENDMARSLSEYGYAGETATGDPRRTTFSYPTFQELQAKSGGRVDLFAGAPYGRVNLVIDGQAEIATAYIASGTYFQVLGVGAAAGRTLGPEDDTPAAPPVAMISHGYWSRRFGLAQEVIGKVIKINNTLCTVVGVTPRGYDGVQGAGRRGADVHLPLSLDSDLRGEDRLSDGTYWWLQILGRLRTGVTPAQVQGALEGVFQAVARDRMAAYLEGLPPEQRALSRYQGRTAVPRLLVDSARRGVYDPNPSTQRDVSLLSSVVVLVLLIVCANVANLLLSRAAVRHHEMGIRLSLGATRRRLVLQLVTESVFLSALGGALGLLVGYWARRLLPFGRDAAFDWRVFVFVAMLSVLTGVAFSLVPALRATRMDPSSSLKEGSRGVAGSRNRLGKGLVVAQVAVSLVLVTAAGLFLNTLRNLRSVDVGFDPTNLLLFRVDPTLNGYDDEPVPLFYEELRGRLKAVPGVQSVSLSRTTFLAGSTSTSSVYFQGDDDDAPHTAYMMTVSPEFFATLNIPLVDGRVFGEGDRQGGPPVAVVNSVAAHEFMGELQPVGQRFGFSPENRGEIKVVGVVRDVKYQNVRDEAPPTIYLPYRQRGVSSMTFEVKTMSEPRALVPAVRAAVRAVDRNVPLMDVSTQEEQIEERFTHESFFALAYSLFGALAMLLTAIGLFGVTSYNVSRRTHEIGLRMALGARRADVQRMILRESLLLVGVGIAVGFVATLVVGFLVANLLFGVAPLYPLTVLVAVIVLVVVSGVAGYLPARRASRVDPMIALQYE